MTLQSLRALYEYELHELRDAESQLIDLLPRMAAAATDTDLKSQFKRHGEQSRKHHDRIASILASIGSKEDEVHCEGMRGIRREAERLLKDGLAEGAVRDAALLSVAQKVEHYEMASYGTLRTYADVLGDSKARDTLQKTLDEEGAADDRLTKIANRAVNPAVRA